MFARFQIWFWTIHKLTGVFWSTTLRLLKCFLRPDSLFDVIRWRDANHFHPRATLSSLLTMIVLEVFCNVLIADGPLMNWNWKWKTKGIEDGWINSFWLGEFQPCQCHQLAWYWTWIPGYLPSFITLVHACPVPHPANSSATLPAF